MAAPTMVQVPIAPVTISENPSSCSARSWRQRMPHGCALLMDQSLRLQLKAHHPCYRHVHRAGTACNGLMDIQDV